MKKILLLVAFFGQLVLNAQVSFDEAGDLLTTNSVISSHPCAVVDINGDGLDDIVRLDNGTELYFNYQGSDGNFTEYYFGSIDGGGWGGDAWGMCVADVDNSGRCDVLAGGSYDGLKIIRAGNLDGQFNQSTIDAPDIFLQGVNFFDIDYDGDLDIFACHDDGPSMILENDGTGVFASGTMDDIFNTAIYSGEENNAGNYGSVWSDVTGDKKTDMYIAKCRQGVTDPSDVRRINQMWIQQSNGTFDEQGEETNTAIGWQSWSADFGDIDNDGDMDMFVGNHDYSNQLYENLGNGVFADISASSGIEDVFSSIVIQSIFRDFDNDGFIDILITGGNEYSIAMNNGDKTFTAAGEVFGNFGMNSFACGDLNNDGKVDVYGTEGGYGAFNANTADMIFLNTSEGGENYINIDLDAVVSAPDGVGAIITCSSDGITQMREVRSGESYGIQNSMTVHFGLDYTDQVYPTITVYWPSGFVDQMVATSMGTTTIIEGTISGVQEGISDNDPVYPNPASDKVNVRTSTGSTIRLLDVTGKVVYETQHNGSPLWIDRNLVAAGTYMLQITDGMDTTVHRLILQ